MEPFVRFYLEIWGIKRFYFLITITDQDINLCLNKIQELNSELNINIEYFTIQTEPFITVNRWGQIKRSFLGYLQNVVPPQCRRSLCIDNDEFYYISHISIVERVHELHFHFLELIPHEKFNPKKDFVWSLQGWFYRVNYFSKSNETERVLFMSPDELKKFKVDILESDGNQKIGVTHQWCKLIRFDRDKMLYPWEHQDGGYLCEKLKKTRSIDTIKDILHKNYFCFHMGVPDRKYFIEKKTRWINPDTNNITMQVGDIIDDQNIYFDRYYSNSLGIKFKDNFLQRFFK
ncbi:MAG: hypothetical protein WDZ85_00020 [Candidatus Paceibacterota bacterium]